MVKYFIALCAFFWIVSSSSGQEKIKVAFPFSKIGFDSLINSNPKLDSLGSVYKQLKMSITDTSFIRGYSEKLDTTLMKKAFNTEVPDSTFVLNGNRFFKSLNLDDSLELNLFDSAYSDKIMIEVSELESPGLMELPGLMDSVLRPSSFNNDQIIPSLDKIPTGLGDKFGTVQAQFSDYVDSNFDPKGLYSDSAAVGKLTDGAFASPYFTDSVAFSVALDDLPELDSLNLRTLVDGVLTDSLKQIDGKLQEFLLPDAGLEIPSEKYLRENFLSDTLLNRYLETFSIDKSKFAGWDSGKITESIRGELPPVPEFEKEYQAISTRIVSLKDRDLLDSVRNLVSRKLYRIKDEVQDSLSVYLIAEKEKLKDNLFFEGLVNAEEYAGDLSVTDFSGSLGVKVKQFYEVGVGPEIGVLGSDFSAIGARFFARREVLENRLFAVVENSYRKGSGIPADLERMEKLYSNWKIGASTLFKLSPSGNTKLNFQTLLNPQYLKSTYSNLVDFRFGISKLSKKQ